MENLKTSFAKKFIGLAFLSGVVSLVVFFSLPTPNLVMGLGVVLFSLLCFY